MVKANLKTGRPTKYSSKLASDICDAIAANTIIAYSFFCTIINQLYHQNKNSKAYNTLATYSWNDFIIEMYVQLSTLRS